MSSAQELFYNDRNYQQQQLLQVSFHFWNCQLTEASPRYRWQPDSSQSNAQESLEHSSKRRQGNRRNNIEATETGEEKPEKHEANGKSKNARGNSFNGEGKKGEKINGEHQNGESVNYEDVNDNGEAATDADYMQHVLKVNACILGPKAAGVHLIAVRTRCYKQEEPDSCPIVCIDPASQRTVALGYEFVLDSQNEVVTFELVEGSGPVWLTGLHQVYLNDADWDDDCESDGEETEIGSDEESDELCVIDDTSRFRLAGVNFDDDEAGDEQMDEAEDQEDGEGDGENPTSGKAKRVGKRSPITTAQLRSRKRRRLASGDENGEADAEGNGETASV